MSITATVENDAIKLPEGVHLPDGTEVRIEPIPAANSAGLQAGSEPETNRFRRSALDLPPLDLGAILRPLEPEDDLLGEMLDDARF